MNTKAKCSRALFYVGTVIIFAVLSGYFILTSYAYTAKSGTVTGSNVNVRSGPGTSNSKVTQVNKGQAVTISNEDTSTGDCWYEVSFQKDGTSYAGWILATYVAVDSQSNADPAYAATLAQQGFPESYCSYLAALHEKYPNWQFEAVQTGLDWNTVIEKEGAAGKNLVQNSVNDARKSTDSACYDWSTNSWYIYDGSTWVGASKEYIAYCMDPRNWLNETDIFQFETLAYASYQNEDGVSNILADSFMSGKYKEPDGTKKKYSSTFVEVGKEIGVSPYHLASRCRQEQGTDGTSQLISGTYPGYENYFNYFNVGAYGSNTDAVVESGLKYAKSQGWNTRYGSIKGGSQFVASKYIGVGQNTIYFEKFNVVNANGGLYSHQYMTNVMGAISEGKSMASAYTDKTQAFVFRIPVYQNMPATTAFSDSGNPNNWLSSLKISGCSLTPTFSGKTTSYSVVVSENIDSVKVSTEAVADTSKISGTGTYTLAYGDNTIEVTCTSQSGDARTYKVKIVRQGSGGNSTGNITYGDINNDGKISNADIVLLKRHILQLSTLSGDALKAADVNRDGKISNADIVKVKRHILGLETIPNE